MSFKIVNQASARLNRSELAFPGSISHFIDMAVSSAADVVYLDLEDAVAPDDKIKARKNVIDAINELGWRRKTVSVCINGLDTQYCYRDVIDVVEKAGNKLDLIIIPKVGTSADVYAINMIVTQICEAKGFTNKIGFEIIIETALGMQNMSEIAVASNCNESLHFCVADYAASTKARSILKAMKEAQKEGKGAVTLDGHLVDIASIRQAEVMVKKAREVARVNKETT